MSEVSSSAEDALTPFALVGRNPDVLTCIANLSNDEVFTPPELANQMLDTLEQAWADTHGSSLWSDSTVTFLDPFTKSGVFLREIAKRLVEGLANDIPNLENRVDHIVTNQVYGIAITELTAMLARRSLYCSKWANGEHSIAKSLTTKEGNIWFERTEHTWEGGTEWVLTADDDGNEIRRFMNGRCRFCRASQIAYERSGAAETHAYAFIHTDNAQARVGDLFGENMKFDVVIGNPPYQLGSDGGTRDVPIYQHFVDQAKALEPRFLSMVIPSRWTAGGLGLDAFRSSMLSDRRLAVFVDYPNAAELFPSVGINGGIGYFLWDAVHDDECSTTLIRDGAQVGPYRRRLDEFDILVRDVRALGILRKVIAEGEPSMTELLSADKEFGMTSNFDGFRSKRKEDDVALHYNRKMKRLVGWMKREDVPKSHHLIDTWKVLVPSAGSGRERERTGVDLVLGPTLIASTPSVCTQTYLFVPVANESEATSAQSYLRTRLVRFLISLRKISQHATRSTYTWVPQQAWDRHWTDTDLYTKYGITEEEQGFIESMIRPIEVADA